LAVPFGHLREKVQSGQLTDWPDEQWTHSELQTNWQCAAPTLQSAYRILMGLIDRAIARGFAWMPYHDKSRHEKRGWFFHPEYFTDEGKAA
jgi:hypothetical protein